MVKVRQDVDVSDNKFRARANVFFSIPLRGLLKEYNDNYLSQYRAVNGDNARLPENMYYVTVKRGDVLTFSDNGKVNADTGAVIEYPMEVFDKYSKMTMQFPHQVPGNAKENFEKIRALSPTSMQKIIDDEYKKTEGRFIIQPFLEKYTGKEPDLD